METHPIFQRYPELKEFLRILRHEIQQAQRPASEIVLDDQQVIEILKISKRKLQYMKSQKAIPYHTPKSGNRTYYLLSDILDWLKKHRVENISSQLKIKI